MKTIKTQGILLKKTILPNEDAFLEFLTPDHGKISVSIKRLNKSPKKIREIDFFRIISLEIQEIKQRKRLKEVSTTQCFNNFQKSYKLTQQGFEWIKLLQKVHEENLKNTYIFKKVIKIFTMTTENDLEWCDLFLRIKILDTIGLFVRFDTQRNDIFVSPYDFSFSTIRQPNYIFLKNNHRQCVEFLRRETFESFWQKKELLPKEAIHNIKELLDKIEEYHY